jgi:hypothetical protein
MPHGLYHFNSSHGLRFIFFLATLVVVVGRYTESTTEFVVLVVCSYVERKRTIIIIIINNNSFSHSFCVSFSQILTVKNLFIIIVYFFTGFFLLHGVVFLVLALFT